jgi:hypothetical protein
VLYTEVRPVWLAADHPSTVARQDTRLRMRERERAHEKRARLRA